MSKCHIVGNLVAWLINIMRQADVYEVYKVHNHHRDDPQVVNGTAKSLL